MAPGARSAPAATVRAEIEQHLATAQIILVLVSADFVGSDELWDVELKTALDRHDQGKALVIPILLRPCDLGTTRLADLRALPDGSVTRSEGTATRPWETRRAGAPARQWRHLAAGKASLWRSRRDEEAHLRRDHDLGRDRGPTFLERIERVALLRDPGAQVTRHAAPPLFAGVLGGARDGRGRAPQGPAHRCPGADRDRGARRRSTRPGPSAPSGSRSQLPALRADPHRPAGRAGRSTTAPSTTAWSW